MWGWLIGGVVMGNIRRSRRTDRNFHDAKAKNEKANRIVEEAVGRLESAVKASEKEQNKLLNVRKNAYDTLVQFAETFKTIDDVRLSESHLDNININILSKEDISMLREIHFEPQIFNTSRVGDSVGLMSMFLPIGFGDFGSFSSLKESKAAYAEAESNLYEAEGIVREIESRILVVDALEERCKLYSDVLSGIYQLWYKPATEEFVRLVQCKNRIKYYFLKRDGKSVFSNEEFSFIAMLASLSKTVKSLIDVELFDENEKQNMEIDEDSKAVKLVETVAEQAQQDKSFGLDKTYCAPLITNEINASEFVRPSDYFLDDYEGTMMQLAREGYESICQFADYVLVGDTLDTREVREEYTNICNILFMEDAYMQLYNRIVGLENTRGNRYGYRTLYCLRESITCKTGTAAYQLLNYLDERVEQKSGLRSGSVRKEFAGMRSLVDIFLHDISGRGKSEILKVCLELKRNALVQGYQGNAFAKLSKTIAREQKKEEKRIGKLKAFRELEKGTDAAASNKKLQHSVQKDEKEKIAAKETPSVTTPLTHYWDFILTFLFGGMLYLAMHQGYLVRWPLVMADISLYLILITGIRKREGDSGLLLRLPSYICVMVSLANLFHRYAGNLVDQTKFTGINMGIFVLIVIGLLILGEIRNCQCYALSCVLWLSLITNYMLFILNFLYSFNRAKAVLNITVFLYVTVMMVLFVRFERKSLRELKENSILREINAMLVIAGACGLIRVASALENAKFWMILLGIVAIFLVGVVGLCIFASESKWLKTVSLILLLGDCFALCLLVFGLLHCVFPFGKTFSLVITEIIYLIIACFLGAVVCE